MQLHARETPRLGSKKVMGSPNKVFWVLVLAFSVLGLVLGSRVSGLEYGVQQWRVNWRSK